MMAHDFPAIASPAGADQMCFQRSASLSLLPAGVILSFLVRGWAAHPIRAWLIALLASGAFGSLIVHARCSFMAPRHLIRPLECSLRAGCARLLSIGHLGTPT